MNPSSFFRPSLRLATALALGGLSATYARAEGKDSGSAISKVPIVMEQATVRGKVAVLETRREERRVIKGLKVRVWSTKEETVKRGHNKRRPEEVTLVRDKLLFERETDDLGLFDLPNLDVGDYLLDVSEVTLRLTVIPQSAERAGQTEPKVLLILLPKENVQV